MVWGMQYVRFPPECERMRNSLLMCGCAKLEPMYEDLNPPDDTFANTSGRVITKRK